MAVSKTILDEIKAKKKGQYFNEFKTWVISPGGVITLILFIGTFIAIYQTRQGKK